MALRQLHTVLKRMQNNLKLAAGYQAAMDNLEIKGPHALLPHHPVVSEDKETRPVFNGSAPGEWGPIAFVADIEQAFHQIQLEKQDSLTIRYLLVKRDDLVDRIVAFCFK